LDTDRRSLVLGGGALIAGALFPNIAAAQAVGAGSKPSATTKPAHAETVLYEFAQFQCSHCFDVHTQHSDRIKSAARKAKVKLVFVPVATRNQSPWPAAVFYAMRDLYPRTENLVRNAFFVGVHKEGQSFESLEHVQQYFAGKGINTAAQKVEPGYRWDEVANHTQSDEVQSHFDNSSQVHREANISYVPAFVWVRDEKILSTEEQHNRTLEDTVKAVLRKLRAGV